MKVMCEDLKEHANAKYENKCKKDHNWASHMSQRAEKYTKVWENSDSDFCKSHTEEISIVWTQSDFMKTATVLFSDSVVCTLI